jgi:3-oxoacyl-[acyl-carrier protein] reductase
MALGLAEQLLPYDIAVNAIALSPAATPMLGKKEGDSVYHPSNLAGRYAMPNEIAELAAFMVSGMENLIVGDKYYITGGGGTIDLQN